MAILKRLIVELIFESISNINKCHTMNSIQLINDVNRDSFHLKKEEEITIISLNINSLRTEEWTVKNNIMRDFIVKLEADIIAMQETNVN